VHGSIASGDESVYKTSGGANIARLVNGSLGVRVKW
jgi:hypothetical protein